VLTVLLSLHSINRSLNLRTLFLKHFAFLLIILLITIVPILILLGKIIIIISLSLIKFIEPLNNNLESLFRRLATKMAQNLRSLFLIKEIKC
jgi:hypothetical protein